MALCRKALTVYREKRARTVEAEQWWKNGDHPNDYQDVEIRDRGDGHLRPYTREECKANDWEGAVVRRFRRPDVVGDSECEQCVRQVGQDGTLRYYTMDEHGWLEAAGNQGGLVHPGDWIVDGGGAIHVVDRLSFPRHYEIDEGESRDYRKERDAAYTERNRLVAALARLYPRSWLADHRDNPGVEWDPQWRTVVFIKTGFGQLSWHLHDDDVHLFAGLPRGENTWDGHTTAEKYERVAKIGRGAVPCVDCATAGMAGFCEHRSP